MIDAAFFRRFYILSSILCILAVIGTYLYWRTPFVAGGVLAGAAVGIFPFITWQIVGKLLGTRTGRIVAVGITLIKYGFLVLGLYLLLVNELVHPFAFMAGMLLVTTVFFVLALARIALTPAKEVA